MQETGNVIPREPQDARGNLPAYFLREDTLCHCAPDAILL